MDDGNSRIKWKKENGPQVLGNAWKRPHSLG